MEINLYVNRYKNACYNFFKWRYELEFYHKIILAVSFACITGLLAQVRFYLPGSQIPLTAQTFAVVLSAVVLGKWWGGISQSIYVGVGLMGMPWFAGMNGGASYVMGWTGGYLVGFIIAAFFLGYIIDTYVKSRRYLPMFALMLFANFAIVFGFGLLYYYLCLSAVGAVDLWFWVYTGLIVCIPGELLKIGIVTGISGSITPRQAYAKEVDAA